MRHQLVFFLFIHTYSHLAYLDYGGAPSSAPKVGLSGNNLASPLPEMYLTKEIERTKERKNSRTKEITKET